MQFYTFRKSVGSSWYFPDVKESAYYNYTDIEALLLFSSVRYRKDSIDKQALKIAAQL